MNKLSEKMLQSIKSNTRVRDGMHYYISDDLRTLKALMKRGAVLVEIGEDVMHSYSKKYCFGRKVRYHTTWSPRITHYLSPKGIEIYNSLMEDI